MNALELLIAGSVGLGITFLAIVVVQQRTYHQRMVSARIAGNDSGLQYAPGSVLKVRRPTAGALSSLFPLSAAATERMQRELVRAGWALRPSEFLAIRSGMAAAGAVAGLVIANRTGLDLFLLRAAVVIGLTVVGWMLPRFYLSWRRQQRLERIEHQLPDALTAMAKSLRAGSGILQALDYAAHETPAPLGPELEATLRDLQLGAEGEVAFANLSERVGSSDLDIAVTAIVIQRTVGGSLSEILLNVSNTVRQRHQLYREVQVLTSRQRLTANLVAAMPVFIAVVFLTVNPKMTTLLTQTTPGRIALAVGIAFELFGIWMVRRLSRIEV